METRNNSRIIPICNKATAQQPLEQYQKAILFIILSILGFIVYNLSGYNSFFDGPTQFLVRVSVSATLLFASLLTYNLLSERNRCYLITFFGISFGFLLANIFGNWYEYLGFTTSTIEGFALAKFAEVVPIMLSVLVVSLASRNSLEDILLRGGKIPRSMALGLLVTPLAIIQYLAMGGLSVTTGIEVIVSWLPWLMLFGFSNAIMEETIFRGLFFKKYEHVLGNRLSLIQTSLVFAILHISLLPFMGLMINVVFVVFLFFQGFAWGWVIQKSDSIWGGVLAHAIADILFAIIIFGVV